MDVTFMRRATAPVAMSGTAEDEDEGEYSDSNANDSHHLYIHSISKSMHVSIK